jgi:MFS family permease
MGSTPVNYNYNPTTWNWGYIATQAATFGLKLLGCIAILVIGYFAVSFLSKMLDRLLVKIGFDKMLEKGGLRQAMMRTGFDPAMVVSKIVFYSLMLFVVGFALSIFGPNPISDLFSRFIAFFPNIIVAIVITIIAAAVASAVRDIISSALGGLSYGRAIGAAAYIGILMLGVFMALSQLSIAPAIINGLWYAMLAIVVGVTVVAVGGGGVKPMEERWRSALNRAEQEIPRVASQVSEASAKAPAAPMYTNSNQPGMVYPQNPNSGYVS